MKNKKFLFFASLIIACISLFYASGYFRSQTKVKDIFLAENPKSPMPFKLHDTKSFSLGAEQDEIIFKIHSKLLKKQGASREVALQDLINYQKDKKNSALVAQEIAYYYKKGWKSLFASPKGEDPLSYEINHKGINEVTDAVYYTSDPSWRGIFPDFDLLIPTNFGLRTYFFSKETESLEHVWGDYNTAYYSASYSRRRDLIAISAPGLYRIDIYKRKNFEKVMTLHNYAALSVKFHEGRLYFSGSHKNTDWSEGSIFMFDIDKKQITDIYLDKQLADCRGFTFWKDYLLASNGAKNMISMLNLKNGELTNLTGFSYPNGISINSDGNLLVADEHHQVIREIDLVHFNLVWSSPMGQLKSPGNVIEIKEGKYAKNLLVADTDNQRVLIVEPKTWDIKFEMQNLRSVLTAIPIFN